jgi:2'-5' RNA ligase
MRAFIAIELPDAVREHLARVQAAIADLDLKAAKPIPRDNLHITVKFLGAIDPKKVDELAESLQLIHRPGAAMLQAQDLECFPLRGRIRIIGAGVGGDLTPLLALHKAVEQRCQYLGFAAEARGFRPHITLARAKSGLPPSTRQALAAACQPLWPGPTFTVTQLTLMQSILRQEGAEYRPVRAFAIDS